MACLRLTALLCALALPAAAADLAKGPDITAAITGNTVQGTMSGGAAYTEYYDADGTIRGDGYAGQWAVEGDTMCFTYGTDPATCHGVGIVQGQVSWNLDGALVGTGMLAEGNPNGW